MITWYEKPIMKFIGDVKQDEVTKREFGDCGNLVNMIIQKVNIQNIRKLVNPNAVKKYTATVETAFIESRDIERATLMIARLAYHNIYFDNIEEMVYEVHGKWTKE